LQQIAALYVETGGSYYNLEGVTPLDQDDDARMYNGPWPVVAHPPCQRWGKFFAGSTKVIADTGVRKRKGDDLGCFKSAMFDLQRFGGVLEHPWGSYAWQHFGLNKPSRSGGWVKADDKGGWTCCVEQGRYGHYCPKPTKLLVYGVDRADLPELEWGIYKVTIEDFPAWAVEKYGEKKCRRIGLMSFKGGGTDSSVRIATPPEFRDILIAIARSAKQPK